MDTQSKSQPETKPPSKKEVTDDDLYRNSTQYRLWSFTREDLRARQQDAHRTAAGRISQLIQTQYPDSGIEPLTFEEEQLLVRSYASKIEAIVNLFSMPSQVKATAASYFRKFYLVFSVMDYHPKNVMFTAAFLAMKSENCFVSLDNFCSKFPRLEPKDILDLEFHLLQSLSFTLAVRSGLQPLHGFYLDMQAVLGAGRQAVGAAHDNARQVVSRGFITDAPFLYSPPQIALAGLYHANKDLTLEYLSKKFSDGGSTAQFLQSVLDECLEELQRLDVPSSEQGKDIDRKLYACMNPEKHIQRVKQKRAAAGADGAAASKRLRTDNGEAITASPSPGLPPDGSTPT